MNEAERQNQQKIMEQKLKEKGIDFDKTGIEENTYR